MGIAEDAIIASCTLVVIPNLARGGQPYGLIESGDTRSLPRTRFRQAAPARGRGGGVAGGCYKVMLMTGLKKPSTLAFYAAAGLEQNKTGFQARRLVPRQEVLN
jgi:hypothetical protein